MNLRSPRFLLAITFLAAGASAWHWFHRIAPWPPVYGKRYPSRATFLTSDGRRITLAEFRGKYVVVHYIEPNCAADLGNAKSLSDQFEWHSEGQSGRDPRVIWVEVLLSSLRNTPPSLSDIQEWETTMNAQRQRRPVVLGVSPELTAPAYAQRTYQTHGFQLLDRQGVVRADVTGTAPKHYWPGVVERLAYMLRTSSDSEPPAAGSTVAEPSAPVIPNDERTDCLTRAPTDILSTMTELAARKSAGGSVQAEARTWLELARHGECLTRKLNDIFITYAVNTPAEMIPRCSQIPADQLSVQNCPYSLYTHTAGDAGIPIRLTHCDSTWRFHMDPVGYEKYLDLWPTGPSVDEAKSAVQQAREFQVAGCASSFIKSTGEQR